MDKRTLKHLERLFAAEIEGRNIQLPKRSAAPLIRDGLAQTDTHMEPVPPLGMMRVEYHILTHAGRYAYCQTCTDTEEPNG